jgi:hypothetical protein
MAFTAFRGKLFIAFVNEPPLDKTNPRNVKSLKNL